MRHVPLNRCAVAGIFLLLSILFGMTGCAKPPIPDESKQLLEDARFYFELVKALPQVETEYPEDYIESKTQFEKAEEAFEKQAAEKMEFAALKSRRSSENILRQMSVVVEQRAQKLAEKIAEKQTEDADNPLQEMLDEMNNIVVISKRIQEKENVIQREDSKKIAEASLVLPWIEETVTNALAETLESDDVSFDRGQYELTDRGKKELQEGFLERFLKSQDDFMNKYPGKRFMIHIKTVGYTDSAGFTLLTTKKILDTLPEGTVIPNADPERRIFLNDHLSTFRAQSLYEYLAQSISNVLAGNYDNIRFAPKVSIGKGEKIPPNILSPYPDSDPRRRICKIFSYITIVKEEASLTK